MEINHVIKGIEKCMRIATNRPIIVLYFLYCYSFTNMCYFITFLNIRKEITTLSTSAYEDCCPQG